MIYIIILIVFNIFILVCLAIDYAKFRNFIRKNKDIKKYIVGNDDIPPWFKMANSGPNPFDKIEDINYHSIKEITNREKGEKNEKGWLW